MFEQLRPNLISYSVDKRNAHKCAVETNVCYEYTKNRGCETASHSLFRVLSKKAKYIIILWYNWCNSMQTQCNRWYISSHLLRFTYRIENMHRSWLLLLASLSWIPDVFERSTLTSQRNDTSNRLRKIIQLGCTRDQTTCYSDGARNCAVGIQHSLRSW